MGLPERCRLRTASFSIKGRSLYHSTKHTITDSLKNGRAPGTWGISRTGCRDRGKLKTAHRASAATRIYPRCLIKKPSRGGAFWYTSKCAGFLWNSSYHFSAQKAYTGARWWDNRGTSATTSQLHLQSTIGDLYLVWKVWVKGTEWSSLPTAALRPF